LLFFVISGNISNGYTTNEFSFMKRVVIIFSFKKQYGYEKIGAMGANSDT
jgi:hypothetical protein